MANPLITKNSNTAGAAPLLSDLELGELGLNTNDSILFARKKVGDTESIVNIGGPDFGSKNLITTGTLTSANVTVTSTTLPAYGLYKFDSNTIALSANSSPKLYISKDGRLGVNVVPVDGTILRVGKTGTSTAFNLTLLSGGPGDVGVENPNITFASSSHESEGTTVIATKGSFGSRYLAIATGTDGAGVDKVLVTHSGAVRLTEQAIGIQFQGDTSSNTLLNDYEKGWYNSAGYFRLVNPTDGTSFSLFHPSIWNSQGNYIKVGNAVSSRTRVQGLLNDNISNLSTTTYDSYNIVYVLPFTVAVTGTDYGPGRVVPAGTIYWPQAASKHNQVFVGISTTYCYDTIYGTWGSLRTALTSAPNYQVYVQVHYIAD